MGNRRKAGKSLNRKLLVTQVDEALKSKCVMEKPEEKSKFLDIQRTLEARKQGIRNEDGTAVDYTQDKIYSYKTLKSYMEHCKRFVKYCRSKYRCAKLEDCKQYAAEWLQKHINEGKSPYTIQLERCALAKLYGVSGTSFGIEIPKRERKNITRSRGIAVRDSHFSEMRNKELVEFCRSTGLRRDELEHLRGRNLTQTGNKYCLSLDGKHCKGGRSRTVEIVGNIELVVKKMRSVAPDELVWGRVTGCADIHSYRADYAQRVYSKYARPLKNLQRREIYHCRKDLAGVCYDRRAMFIASKNLGHNRIDVIVSHYLGHDNF